MKRLDPVRDYRVVNTVRIHHGLLASKFGKKASTNLVAIQRAAQSYGRVTPKDASKIASNLYQNLSIRGDHLVYEAIIAAPSAFVEPSAT